MELKVRNNKSALLTCRLGQGNPALSIAMQYSGCTLPEVLVCYPWKEILELNSQQALWNGIINRTCLPNCIASDYSKYVDYNRILCKLQSTAPKYMFIHYLKEYIHFYTYTPEIPNSMKVVCCYNWQQKQNKCAELKLRQAIPCLWII